MRLAHIIQNPVYKFSYTHIIFKLRLCIKCVTDPKSVSSSLPQSPFSTPTSLRPCHFDSHSHLFLANFGSGNAELRSSRTKKNRFSLTATRMADVNDGQRQQLRRPGRWPTNSTTADVDSGDGHDDGRSRRTPSIARPTTPPPPWPRWYPSSSSFRR